MILVCTPSNTAINKLMRDFTQLIEADSNDQAIFRVYASSALDPNDNFCAPVNPEQTVKLPTSTRIVFTTLTTAPRVFRDNGWLVPDFVFVDEAGQADEVETLMSFVYSCKPSTQIILAGDPHQLGPIAQHPLCKKHRMDRSMLDRLMGLKEYKPLSPSALGIPPTATILHIDSYGSISPAPSIYDPNYVVKLVQNYRSHRSILDVPSRLFYDNDLVAAKYVPDYGWPELPRPDAHVVFEPVLECHSQAEHSSSFYNLGELDKIQYWLKVATRRGVKPVNIAVLTPYSLQARKIEDALANTYLSNVCVGTTEKLQGDEREVVIVSTVRSFESYGDDYTDLEEQSVGLGFLTDYRRFNVAVTRAKNLLVLIGNPHVLRRDKHWSEYLDFIESLESIYLCSLFV
jgi:helicase MOV-10